MRLPFGAVVATAKIVACVHFDDAMDVGPRHPLRWMQTHEHTEGPWCWVLDNIRVLDKPVPARGQQGLWEWNEEDQGR